jgi:hypothetical protein
MLLMIVPPIEAWCETVPFLVRTDLVGIPLAYLMGTVLPMVLLLIMRSLYLRSNERRTLRRR